MMSGALHKYNWKYTNIYAKYIYKAEDKQVEQSQNKKLMKVFIEANNYETKDMHNRERNDNEAC